MDFLPTGVAEQTADDILASMIAAADDERTAILEALLNSVQAFIAANPPAPPAPSTTPATIGPPPLEALVTVVTAMITRDTTAANAAPGKVVVQGRVVDSTGKPLPNHTAALSTSARMSKGDLPTADTDEDGFAAITIHVEENPELFKESSEVFLFVTDPTGRRVFAHETPINLGSHRMHTFRATAVTKRNTRSTKK